MTLLVRIAPFVGAALLTACGSSSTVTLTPPTSLLGTAPQALVAITPAPGVPTIAPSSTVYVAASPSAPVPASATLPPSSPAPAPSGSDLAALVAGKAPSASYFASLSAPETSAVAQLGTSGAPRAILGTILGFSNNGFTLKIPTPDLSAALQAGAAYAAETDAAGASEIVVHVSSQTVDGVPGGYGTLRTSMPVLVAGSGPPTNFTAVAVVANPNDTASASALARTPIGAAASAVAPSPRRSVSRHRLDSGVRQTVPFALTRTFGFPGITAPNPPYYSKAAAAGCVQLDLNAFVTAGFGETANYPMLLQDVSDLSTYVEGQEEELPVRLVDAPATGMTTYRVNYGVSVNISANVVLANCGIVKNGTYTLSIVTVGQAIESSSTAPLPATGDTVLVEHNSCPFIPAPLEGVASFFVNLPTPSVSACFDFNLTGATIKATGTITNATLDSAQTSGLNGGGLISDTSWNYLSDLPEGDPMVELTPDASPTDGSMQPNVMTLSGMNVDLQDQTTPIFTFCLYADICSSQISFGSFAQASVFESSPGNAIIGISQPSPVSLTLMPTDATIPITVK